MSLSSLMITAAAILVSALLIGLLLGSDAGKQCVFEDAIYQPGQSWHPYLEPFGLMTCINCTCTKNGMVKCDSQKCPKMDCENLELLPGKCCPVCKDNVPREVGPVTVGRTYSACHHDGLTYQHSQVFASSATALRPSAPGQCVLCICLDSDVLCHLKTCPRRACRDVITPPDDCCPHCKDDYEDDEDPTYQHTTPSTYPEDHQPDPHFPDCQFGDHVYPNATKWHPVIGPFGRMECVLCMCKNNRILCERIRCTPDEALPCAAPLMHDGKCCKYCPSGASTEATEPWDTAQEFVLPLLPTDADRGSPSPELLVCPDSSADLLVHASYSKRQYSLAFERLRGHGVEVHTWTLDSGTVKDYKIHNLDVSRFKTREHRKYVILGTTKLRRFFRFKGRLRRFIEKCNHGDTCTRKVLLRQVRRLKIKSVDFKYEC